VFWCVLPITFEPVDMVNQRKIHNVGYRLVSWDSVVRQFPKIIVYFQTLWKEPNCEKFFSDPIFPRGALSTLYQPFFG
jgi:hypothetical protein